MRAYWPVAAALLGLGLVLRSEHRILSTEEAAPEMFVAAIATTGTVGMASTAEVEACARGKGRADFLPLDRDGGLIDGSPSVGCGDLRVLTSAELERALGGRAHHRGRRLPTVPRGPIVDRHRGFEGFPGAWISTRYFVRFNDAFVQLVRWSGGNHWGTELEHTYGVTTTPRGRLLVTERSLRREVELD